MISILQRLSVMVFILSATMSSSLITAGAAQATELRYASGSDLTSLDPHSSSDVTQLAALSNAYEPLVGRGRNSQPIPLLAESWTIISPTIWRFHLRPNVRFHNGYPLTTADVVFSFERAKGDTSDLRSLIASIDKVKVVDELTIDFFSRAPSPLLPREIQGIFIMSQRWAAENNAQRPTAIGKSDFNYATMNANGTGPFKIEYHDPSLKTVFVVNREWWGSLEHNLTRAVFVPIKNAATRVAALLSGEVDLITSLPVQDVGLVNRTDGLKVITANELRVMYLGLDHRPSLLHGKSANPLADKRVRRALQLAIDPKAISQHILGNLAIATGTLIPPEVIGYDPDLALPPKPDINLARDLLRQAGYHDGFDITLNCSNDRYMADAATCTAVAPMLARIGVRTTIVNEPRARFFQKVLDRQVEIYLISFFSPTFDAHQLLQNMFTTPQPDGRGQWNAGLYSSKYLDDVANLAANESDIAERQRLLANAMRVLRDDVAAIPLFQLPIIWAASNLLDLHQPADGYLPLKWVNVRAR